MEADREASGGDKLVQEAALDNNDVQLEAWRAADEGEVVQAEMDLTAV